MPPLPTSTHLQAKFTPLKLSHRRVNVSIDIHHHRHFNRERVSSFKKAMNHFSLSKNPNHGTKSVIVEIRLRGLQGLGVKLSFLNRFESIRRHKISIRAVGLGRWVLAAARHHYCLEFSYLLLKNEKHIIYSSSRSSKALFGLNKKL